MKPSQDEEVVISGISGKFPECDNIEEFYDKLYAGADLLSDDERRFPLHYLKLPRMGMLKDITKFDSEYFEINGVQAETMDPQVRMMLEISHEAIIDSGTNPEEIRGSNIGVYVGQCGSEASEFWTRYVDNSLLPYITTGHAVSLFANRISYAYDLKGPSMAIDTACSSSFNALNEAFYAIKRGDCDGALVAGCRLCQTPYTSMQFLSMQMISPEGQDKPFDEDAKGYVRSEAICVMFIQKKSLAKRNYGTILNVNSNCDGYTKQSVMFPSVEMQMKLMQKVYNDINIDPSDVEYVEAHATGTQAGDSEEANAITNTFYVNRDSPVLTGSGKSNMGHSEPTSGLCAIAKMILTMERGIIPQTINYEKPNKNIPGLQDGRLKIVVENTPYHGGLVAVNNFGFGGSNVHAVIKPNPKTEDSQKTNHLSKLVAVSGRTEEAVKHFLDKVEKTNSDYALRLVHDIHSSGNIRHHGYRGYSIFDTKEPLTEITRYEEVSHSVWFVFPGIGTQWQGMGKDLMDIEIFKESIRKCSAVLQTYGINIYDIISTGKADITTKQINLIAISVIQIAMVDLLFSLGIYPNGLIGHSNGELIAAYADGALTLEQTVLCAYFKVKSLLEEKLPKGLMASIGLPLSEAEARCPPSVYIACDNSDDNVTVAGDYDTVQGFVNTLQSENIFAKILLTGFDLALHTKDIVDIAPIYKNYLQKVITNPMKWSTKWISTTIPSSKSKSELSQMCSAEYFVNNAISPVYFREALMHIPDNAVVIEVSPHCSFQSILKRSLLHNCINIGLANQNVPNNLDFFLSSVGKMYNAGLQPKIQELYPKVDYPVPRGTPGLATMVEWDHSKSWKTHSFIKSHQGFSKFIFPIFTNRDQYQFLKGHVINGHTVYPAAGYLFLVWNGYSRVVMKDTGQLSVMFQNVQFLRATHIDKEDIDFHVDILTSSGEFEVRESGALVATGKITEVQEPESVMLHEWSPPEESNNVSLSANEIYKELRLRHYEYSGLFKGISKASIDGLRGELQWNDNWICFLDAILQFCVLGYHGQRKLCVPTAIEKIIVDSKKINSLQVGEKVPVLVNKDFRTTQAGGIEVCGLKTQVISGRSSHPPPTLNRYACVPYDNTANTQFTVNEANKSALSAILQIVLENLSVLNPHIVEVAGSKAPENLLALRIANTLKEEPGVNANFTEIVDDIEKYSKDETLSSIGVRFIGQNVVNKLENESIHLLAGTNVLAMKENNEFFKTANFLKPDAFILVEESSSQKITTPVHDWDVACHYMCEDRQFILLRKAADISNPIVITFTEKNFSWMKNLKLALKESEDKGRKVILVNTGEKTSGIIGMVNCLKKEPGGKNLRCVFVRDEQAPGFSLVHPFYLKQLKKDLVMNVYTNNSWGSYRHIKLEKSTTKDVEQAHISILTPGNLNSLTWTESPVKNDPNLCQVYYSALNFRDVMLATGKLPISGETASTQDITLGLEFSGCDINGHRVCGIVENNGISTSVVANPSIIFNIPDQWTLEQAATVPVVYMTAYYALIVRGEMNKGESILIHAGCGGVGLAAITIALHMGVTVYTTVGSQEKRDFLKKRFPQLADKNIANSRDTSFENDIMEETDGNGVDLVLNSLAEDKLHASLRCLAKNGRFLEIGKLDLIANTPIGMSLFLRNTTFHGIVLESLFCENQDELSETLELVRTGIITGAVQPLPTTVFSADEVLDAFKFLGSAKHIGKVLVKIREDEKDKILKPPKKVLTAISQIYFDDKKVYVIVGGLGGFGLELANWLVTRGAKKLVLTSRKGVKDGYQVSRIKLWKSMNVNVIISTVDCTQEKGVLRLISEASKSSPVGGIFNLAGILNDNVFDKLSEQDFVACCMPKVNITKNLDYISRKQCPVLDYFVVFSSLSSGRGNNSQSNYGLANSAIERICESRKDANLPALAIQWGPIADVGMVSEVKSEIFQDILGVVPQRISSCLSTLDTLLTEPYPVVSSVVIATNKSISASENVDILEVVGDTMGIANIKEMSPNSTLSQLGADSYMMTAIKQALERHISVVLNPEEILNLTLEKIKELSNLDGNDAKDSFSSQSIIMKSIA